MPDINIAKTYKDIESRELLNQFCAKLRDHELPSSYSDNPAWTRFVKTVMREIGSSLGYQIRQEGYGGEFMEIDQTWRIHEPNLIKTFLALEVENATTVEPLLDDELEKLVDIKSDLKVLAYYPYPFTAQSDMQDIKRIMEVIKNGDSKSQERYVIIMMTADASREDRWVKYSKLAVRAFEIRDNKSNQLGDSVEVPHE